MKLKLFKQKKKNMGDPHWKKTNYLFSPEESISYRSTYKGNLETPEEWAITLNHLLDT